MLVDPLEQGVYRIVLCHYSAVKFSVNCFLCSLHSLLVDGRYWTSTGGFGCRHDVRVLSFAVRCGLRICENNVFFIRRRTASGRTPQPWKWKALFHNGTQVKRVGVVAIVRFSGSAAFSTQTPIIIIKIAVNHTSHVKFIDDFSK
jgi:hypothetical protein